MGGSLELYLIYQYGDKWEEEWAALQGAVELDLPVVSKETMDHALRGWTKPLVSQLGPPPQGKLLQLPKPARQCQHRKTCPLYDSKACGLMHRDMPWCFEPEGIHPGGLAAEIVKLWRDEVYVVVVTED
jgi:hypothetical protein